MKQYEVKSNLNPTFNTVTGLTNTTFDPENVVNGRGASEGQLHQVYLLYKKLKDWLDENGCSDDPYQIIRDKIDEVVAKQEECCDNPQDSVVQTLRDRLTAIEGTQNECCGATSGDDDGLEDLRNRLAALEAKIEEACGCNSYTGMGTCDGNVITVSFAWNGINPFQDGGKATAVSANSERQIAGFYFLVRNVDTGMYYRSATAYGGDFTWSIDANGNVIASAGSTMRMSSTIVAVDANGCEGTINVDLPRGNAVS